MRPLLEGLVFVVLVQAIVVAGTQVAPVLVPVAAADIGVEVSQVGAYSTALLAVAMLSSVMTAGLLRRIGSVWAACLALAAVALGVAALAVGTVSAAFLSAIFIGLAYGPINPITSRIMSRLAPPRHHAFLFSFKQTSVALGGASAGALLPLLAQAQGWAQAALLFAGLAIFAAAASLILRRRIGDDSDRLALTSPALAVRAVARTIRTPALRQLGWTTFVLSTAQFGLMSVYVAMLWQYGGLELTVAGSMISLVFLASIPGRLLWGFAADRCDPHVVVAGLAMLTAAALFVLAFLTAAWPLVAIIAVSIGIGLGPMSWAGVLLSQVARSGMRLDPGQGVSDATAAMMVFAYSGGLVGPACLSAAAAFTGSYALALFAIAGANVAAAGVLFWNRRTAHEVDGGAGQ